MEIKGRIQARWKAREGDPHINLCIAVLKEAKRQNTQMWQDFVEEYEMTGENCDGFDVSQWVSGWWSRDLAGKIIYGETEPKEAPSKF